MHWSRPLYPSAQVQPQLELWARRAYLYTSVLTRGAGDAKAGVTAALASVLAGSAVPSATAALGSSSPSGGQGTRAASMGSLGLCQRPIRPLPSRTMPSSALHTLCAEAPSPAVQLFSKLSHGSPDSPKHSPWPALPHGGFQRRGRSLHHLTDAWAPPRIPCARNPQPQILLLQRRPPVHECVGPSHWCTVTVLVGLTTLTTGRVSTAGEEHEQHQAEGSADNWGRGGGRGTDKKETEMEHG
ncbi:hypothetical protein NDU88_000156 [Pleurodeles waltl]|uniref:Uncharacterized protein n=1 Tax=Pleurodeles waltl TaxID=8319 RepID=A0AAV7S3R3_PLEWA|nr:hypothetical protein NDU88_000156 [Pleurodeles waltl]